MKQSILTRICNIEKMAEIKRQFAQIEPDSLSRALKEIGYPWNTETALELDRGCMS